MSESTPPSSAYGMPLELAVGLKKFGLAVPVWDRALSAAEIQYFLDRWLFLQILSSDVRPHFDQIKSIKAKSNWTILNYGDAMASSPGEFLFAAGDDMANPGKGTIWRQAFDTVADMVALAKQLDWPGVQIVDGHPKMKWALWMYAVDAGLEVVGFEPTEIEIERRERVKRNEIEDIKRFQQFRLA